MFLQNKIRPNVSTEFVSFTNRTTGRDYCHDNEKQNFQRSLRFECMQQKSHQMTFNGGK